MMVEEKYMTRTCTPPLDVNKKKTLCRYIIMRVYDLIRFYPLPLLISQGFDVLPICRAEPRH